MLVTDYKPPVTAHAVLRYLTRVEGYNIRPIVEQVGRSASNWTLALACAKALGAQLIELQKRVCPEHLAGLVRGGVATIRRENMVLRCASGVVTTVEVNHSGRRINFKILSKREFRAGAQRRDRRCK